MNLDKAVEVLCNPRKYSDLHGLVLEAKIVVGESQFSELDPTHITEKWLRANGWVKHKTDVGGWWAKDRCRILHSKTWKIWFFSWERTLDGNWPITTLGELRTLLRLAGAREKETDA